MSTHIARLGAAVGMAAIAAGSALALAGPAAWGQTPAPTVSVDPDTGAPGSTFKITMNNYKACPPTTPNCISIDFIQGTATTQIGTANSNGATTFSGDVKVPPTAVPGLSTVRAHADVNNQSGQHDYNVVAAAATTTSTSTSSTSSTSTSTSSTVPATTTSSTSTTLASTTTAVPLKPKKSSEHSDVPRYIAVALVVLAAAATAAVDTRLRRLNRPG